MSDLESVLREEIDFIMVFVHPGTRNIFNYIKGIIVQIYKMLLINTLTNLTNNLQFICAVIAQRKRTFKL